MTQSLKERLETARQRRRDTGDSEAAPSCNYLIVSDTHLGEFIKEHTRIEFLKRAADIDSDFCEFLDYYGTRTADGKPWRLVINGDFLDFLTVTVTPSERARKDELAITIDLEEEVYGLEMDADKVAWKFERIAERHQVVFAYLADFVGRGHYLDMLYGNHDSEFFWDEAKQAFIKHLTNVFFGTEKVPGKSEEAFSARIRWHEWFYYEAGRFYIEHGNQYDDFSSFEYRLAPWVPDNPKTLIAPVSHQVIRYFVNRMAGFRTHNKDNWGLWDFVRWIFEQGTSRMRFIVSSYVDLLGRLLRFARLQKVTDWSDIAARHDERLQQEAERYEVDADLVRRIDTFRNRPIHHRLGGIIQAGGLDRWGLLAAYLMLFTVAWVLPGWSATLVCLALWLVLLAAHKLVLKTVRNVLLGGEVDTKVAPKLDKAAEEIANLLDVRYVFFGHTHKPLIRRVREEPPVWYVNTGCWLVPKHRERHEGGCRSPLTFCELLDRRVPEATLLRWCQREDKPQPFLPHLQAEADDPEVVEVITSGSRVAVDMADVPKVASAGKRRVGKQLPSPRSDSRASLRKRRY